MFQFHASKRPLQYGQKTVISTSTRRYLSLGRGNRTGFTLVEILIAVFIFGIVITTIYTSYTGTSRVVNETEYQADIYRMARITLERIHEDLESVYITQGADGEPSGLDEENGGASDFIGEDAEINGRDADSLRFTSRAHVVFSERDQVTGTAEIEYYISENDEQGHLVLYRSDTPELAAAPREGTGGLVLCEKLASVNFTYYDANWEEHTNWDSTAEGFKDTIPKLVSVSLEFQNQLDPEAPFKFFTTVALPMGAKGNGQGA
jgi:general secretion pathway protein J